MLSSATSASSAAELVRIARQRPALPCGTRIIAIDGPSGSGKTTFAADVEAHLTGLRGDGNDEARPTPAEVQVLHMDDLYPGWDGLAAAVPLLSSQVVEPLAEGRDASYRRYDWERGVYAERHEIPCTARWLVVEGVGCGARVIWPRLSALAWLEADRETRMRRGLERDGEAYRPHWERWSRQEGAHFAREATRDHADLVLDTGQ